MRKTSKILIGTFSLLLLFGIFGVNTALAVGETSVEINGDHVETQVQANNKVMFTFRQRTRLTLNSTVNIEMNINCDALRIGVKYFEMEIDCDQDLQMNMTCTEEQVQLGLLKGNTYQIRNRNRYQYEEGFCLLIQCNCSNQVQAKLKIQANNQNRVGTWAYYDESSEEWVSVPTTVEDGYLTAETDHFSYWTVLIPESENNLMLYIGLISVIGIVAVISAIFFKKRKSRM
ncbi:MAG: hypothetical protein ACFFEN_02780 [Candidatus Thorarchaeota archaeon]